MRLLIDLTLNLHVFIAWYIINYNVKGIFGFWMFNFYFLAHFPNRKRRYCPHFVRPSVRLSVCPSVRLSVCLVLVLLLLQFNIFWCGFWLKTCVPYRGRSTQSFKTINHFLCWNQPKNIKNSFKYFSIVIFQIYFDRYFSSSLIFFDAVFCLKYVYHAEEGPHKFSKRLVTSSAGTSVKTSWSDISLYVLVWSQV